MPLSAEGAPFEEAFTQFKMTEYQLQKSLVDAVVVENYGRADKIKRELHTSAPECSSDVRTQLEGSRGKFVGQCFYHKKYGYRGVIFKPDPKCRMDDSWIDMMGVRRLPRGHTQPFYHCLVDMRDRPGGQTTYVAEENILPSCDAFTVQHPLLGSLFIEIPQLKCYIGTENLERVLDEYDS